VLRVRNGFAYIGSNSGLHVYSLADPHFLPEVGTFDTFSPVLDLQLRDDYAAICGDFGVFLCDCSEALAVDGGDVISPKPIRLSCSPNPFNPNTTLSYSIADLTHVRLDVYNIRGEKIRTLVNERQLPGDYEAVWNGVTDDGVAVGSGIYLFRIQAGQRTVVSKATLLK
jgi:hypothetical protein